MVVWGCGCQCIWLFTFMPLWLAELWPAAAAWHHERVLCHMLLTQEKVKTQKSEAPFLLNVLLSADHHRVENLSGTIVKLVTACIMIIYFNS